MKKLLARLAAFALLLACMPAQAKNQFNIDHFDPPCWWTGMKNPSLQLLVHAPEISLAAVTLDYPGVSIDSIVRVDSPNYLFLYLNISPEAQPGTMNIRFRSGKKTSEYPYTLLPRRTKPGAQGFSTDDVLYLITPDRFANGDPSNDTIGKPAPDPNRRRPAQHNGPGRGDYGRHGGDIKGVVDHIDYIKDLGVTTVWLNPVQQNSYGSYHGYAINDFYAVDPRFGTLDEYTAFVDSCHANGMKVVMDMILNHCGGDHWWMTDPPTPHWLNFDNTFTPNNHLKWSVMDPHAAEVDRKGFTDGWFTRGMPDLNQRDKLMADYLIQSSIWWIEYAGIDGIRQDTHPYMDFDFSSRWCREVMDEYPDFNIVGETWYPSDSGFMAWWQAGSKNNPRNSYLKTVMDFNTAFVSQTAFEEPNLCAERKSTGLFNLYTGLAADFLYEDMDNILVYLDNHDMSRFSKVSDTSLDKYKQGIAFLLTTRGIPQVYYGTELLMTGTKEEGDGRIRKDMPGGWPGDERNAFTPAGRTDRENEAYDYMRTLLQWRKNSEPARRGKLIQYAPVPEHGDCYVYARIAPSGQTVLVVMNGTDNKDAVLDMSRYAQVIGTFTQGTDVATGTTFDLTAPLLVPARGTYILDLK